MKAFLISFFACFCLVSAFSPMVHAGDVEIKIFDIEKTRDTQGNLLIHIWVKLTNHSAAAIPSATVFVDYAYCLYPDKRENVLQMTPGTLSPGQTKTVHGFFSPKTEQSMQIIYTASRNARSYAQIQLDRNRYDSLGAQKHPCKKMKKRLTPQMSVPAKKLKAVKP